MMVIVTQKSLQRMYTSLYTKWKKRFNAFAMHKLPEIRGERDPITQERRAGLPEDVLRTIYDKMWENEWMRKRRINKWYIRKCDNKV